MAPSAPHPLLPPLTGSSKAFFINSPNEDAPVYHDHPTIKNTIRVTLESAGVGLLVSSVQNALEKWVGGEGWLVACPTASKRPRLTTDTTRERWVSLHVPEAPLHSLVRGKVDCRALTTAAMGFAFSFTQNYVANLRQVGDTRTFLTQTDDALNGAAGGCAAGFVAGVRGG